MDGENAATEIEITPEMIEVAELALLNFSREHSLLREEAENLVRRLLECAHAACR